MLVARERLEVIDILQLHHIILDISKYKCIVFPFLQEAIVVYSQSNDILKDVQCGEGRPICHPTVDHMCYNTNDFLAQES